MTRNVRFLVIVSVFVFGVSGCQSAPPLAASEPTAEEAVTDNPNTPSDHACVSCDAPILLINGMMVCDEGMKKYVAMLDELHSLYAVMVETTVELIASLQQNTGGELVVCTSIGSVYGYVEGVCITEKVDDVHNVDGEMIGRTIAVSWETAFEMMADDVQSVRRGMKMPDDPFGGAPHIYHTMVRGVRSLTITPADTYSLQVGRTIQLAVMAEAADGSHYEATSEVVYQISDPSVAAISGAGLVSGIGEGTATIIARHGDMEAVITVTVVK